MKFTKYNNPNKRKRRRCSKYSREYIEARRNEMYQSMSRCDSVTERNIMATAFDVTINP